MTVKIQASCRAGCSPPVQTTFDCLYYNKKHQLEQTGKVHVIKSTSKQEGATAQVSPVRLEPQDTCRALVRVLILFFSKVRLCSTASDCFRRAHTSWHAARAWADAPVSSPKDTASLHCSTKHSGFCLLLNFRFCCFLSNPVNGWPLNCANHCHLDF